MQGKQKNSACFSFFFAGVVIFRNPGESSGLTKKQGRSDKMQNDTAAVPNAYIMRKCARQIHMWAYAPRGADCRFRGPSAFPGGAPVLRMWKWRPYGSSTIWWSQQELASVQMAPEARSDGNPSSIRRVFITAIGRDPLDKAGVKRMRSARMAVPLPPIAASSRAAAQGGGAGGRKDHGRAHW